MYVMKMLQNINIGTEVTNGNEGGMMKLEE
jgi:hypothetical protein